MQTNFSQLTSSERRWCMQRGLCLCCGADSHHSVPSETTLCISKFSSYCSSHSFSILFQSHSDQWPFFCCSYSPHQFGRIIRFSGQLIHQLHLQAIPCSISLLIISIVGKPLGGGIITSLWICFPMYRLYSPREHFTSGSGGLHSHPGTSLVGIAFIPPSHGPCFKATQPRRAYTVYSSSEKKNCADRESGGIPSIVWLSALTTVHSILSPPWRKMVSVLSGDPARKTFQRTIGETWRCM